MKEFTYRGKSLEELKKMDMNEFAKLLQARQRRSLKREMDYAKKRLIEKIKMTNQKAGKKPIKTHLRDMIVTPEMVGVTMSIYTGKEWTPVLIMPEMIGHYFGEFSMTRKKVAHSAPGIGATKSSTAVASKAK